MKFHSTFFATVVTVSVLLFAPTDACEESCRQGISKAFGDNYTTETKILTKTFITNLQENAYSGLESVKSTTKSECNKVIEQGVNQFQEKFSNSLGALIENSIFEQSPQFKGQCQNPLRVKQPPAGVAWTMDDCKKQDYICGNPPAICHFMDQHVKPRNVKNVVQSMTERLTASGSSFSKTLSKAVTDAAKKTGVKGKDLESFSTVVSKNILNECNKFASLYSSEFCKGTTCDKYDNDIKTKLLSFP